MNQLFKDLIEQYAAANYRQAMAEKTINRAGYDKRRILERLYSEGFKSGIYEMDGRLVKVTLESNRVRIDPVEVMK